MSSRIEHERDTSIDVVRCLRATCTIYMRPAAIIPVPLPKARPSIFSPLQVPVRGSCVCAEGHEFYFSLLLDCLSPFVISFSYSSRARYFRVVALQGAPTYLTVLSHPTSAD